MVADSLRGLSWFGRIRQILPPRSPSDRQNFSKTNRYATDVTWREFLNNTIFKFFLSKFRTKRCVTTPLLPFKKWWSTTGRFWDAKYLSTKIIYFHAFFKKFFMISMYRFTICQNDCSDYSSYFSQLNSLHI